MMEKSTLKASFHMVGFSIKYFPQNFPEVIE